MRFVPLLIVSTLCATGARSAPKPVAPSRLPNPVVFEPLPGGDRFLARGFAGPASFEANGFSIGLGAARVRVRFLGAARDAPLRGLDRLSSNSHYLRGGDPSKWRTGVPRFERVRASGVYPGIDVEYYDGGGLEFDLTLQPGAAVSRIRMAFEGGDTLAVSDEGALEVAAGGEILRLLPPTVFQAVEGTREAIAGRYVRTRTGEVGFEIGRYDRSLPLVIDPVVEWATFLGGAGQDQVNAVAVDADGFVYVGGFTTSADFPAANARDGQMDGAIDGFVSKLSPDGSQLIWSTYLGGSLRDEIRGLQVDAQRNVYVSGPTESTDFPTTDGAAQETLNGPTDAFVAKLTPAGDGLVYSTLFGGPEAENAKKLDIDATGAVYLTGESGSSQVPTTPSAFQTGLGGSIDLFLARIAADGSAVEWASYFGGNAIEQVFDIETDPSGGVIVAGSTTSTDLQGTPNAFQPASGGRDDGFIARFTADGGTVDYLTFLGGGFLDSIRGIALDGVGNVWAAGGTASNDLPTTNDADIPDYSGSGTDGLIARLPLPSRIVPGPPAVAPYVSYVGDEITNFGLDLAISRSPAAALSAEGVHQAFGEFVVFYSLSNFSDATGSFGTITEYGPDGQPIDTATLPGADANASAADPRGNGVVFGGVGLQNGQTTPGTVQPIFGGGTGTLPADGFIVRTAPAIFEPVGRTSLVVVKEPFFLPLNRCAAFAPGRPAAFSVAVTNVGTETARNAQIVDRTVNVDFDPATAQRTGLGDLCSTITKTADGDLVCGLGDLPPGQQKQIFLVGTVTGSSELRNIATAVADNADPVSDTVIRSIPDQISLSLTKQLVDPPVVFVQPGQELTYRLMLTNESLDGPAVCVSLSDNFTGMNLKSFMLENPSPDITCGFLNLGGTLLNAGSCFAEDLGAGQSFSVLATFVVDDPVRVDPVLNQATAKAINSDAVDAVTANPVAGGPNGDEEPVVCAFLSSGAGEAAVGQNDLKATLPPVNTSCWVRDQPDSGVLPIQVSADMGIDPANLLNPDGTYSGMGFIVIGQDSQQIQVPVRPGPDAGTVQTDTFDAPVRNNSFGISFSGFRINAAGLSEPTNLLPGFEINTPNGRVPVGAPLQIAPRKEVTTTLSSSLGDDPFFFELNAALRLNNPVDFFEDVDIVRLVLELDGLPPDATAQPMPGCISATPPPAANGFSPDELRALLFLFLRAVPGADENGMGGTATEDCAPVTPEIVNGRMTATWELDSILGDIGDAIVEFFLSFGLEGAEFGNMSVTAGLGPYLPDGANPDDFPAPLYRRPEPIAFSLTAPTPAVTAEGVVSAASNLALSHGLGAIFGGDLAAQTGAAGTLPLPDEINGASVYVLPVPEEDFAGLTPEAKAAEREPPEQSGGYFAPLLFVSPGQINFQLPWEVDLSSGFVDLQVIRDGIASDTVRVAVSEFSPAVFSFDFGPGRAIAINPDGSVAHPVDSFNGAIASRPVRPGEALILLGSGLGPVSPPGISGANSLDAQGVFVRRDTVEIPRVTIGGVEQQVVFSGLSPEFAGVYQLNVVVSEGTPPGDRQPLILEAGGVRSREDVTVAIAP